MESIRVFAKSAGKLATGGTSPCHNGRPHLKGRAAVITIPLTLEDLAKVRVALSPLWETVTSFAVLGHYSRRTVHTPWAARVRRVLPGTDLSTLGAAICLEKVRYLRPLLAFLTPFAKTRIDFVSTVRPLP